MATVVRMPAVLAGATEAAIASWLVAPGDTVAVGTPIAEIETEKALVEYAAEEPGVIGRLVLAVGESGEIGDPIAVLLADGETDADIDQALGASPATASPAATPSATASPTATPAAAAPPVPVTTPVTAPEPETAPEPAAAPPPSAPTAVRPAANGHGPAADGHAPAVSGTAPAVSGHAPAAGGPRRVFASPLVRKRAGQQGIDLAALTGTGPNGRVVRRDLEQFLAARETPSAVTAPQAAGGTTAPPRPVPPHGPGPAAAPAAPAAPAAAGTRLIPHTPMRRAIARRLTESKATTPHFYLTAECVVDELLALRRQVNEAAAVKVSVNDFVIMAVAAAFGDVPEANVTWSADGLVAHEGVDLSIAVATEGGLVTPVLRGVEGKRLSAIARESRDLAARARDKRLHLHELEGGTFSVSNLGMYGTLEFSAIINPPQSGILAVGAATPQPVVVGGALAVATVMRCTLSVDHRAIDGALAARWLAAFTARLQHPLAALI
jgi:pyruvate dehydrogenase E2 component (dihydrolipoamide acetyltransferase)